MVELMAASPMAGILPVEIGGVSVREVEATKSTVLAPFQGQQQALDKVLHTKHGFGWPEVGRLTGSARAGALWFGRAQAMLVGVTPDAALSKHAAMVDQSDAWAVVDLSGARARAGLARLTPIDLRDGVFEVGDTARTELAHMMASITRIESETYRIMVFRAFGRTLLHELTVAFEGVAARGGG